MVVSTLPWHCGGTTTNLEKLSIDQIAPPSGPVMAPLETLLLVLLLPPRALQPSGPEGQAPVRRIWHGLRTGPPALIAAILLAGVAPLSGLTPMALGLVENVATLFDLNAIFTIRLRAAIPQRGSAPEPTAESVRDSRWCRNCSPAGESIERAVHAPSANWAKWGKWVKFLCSTSISEFPSPFLLTP